MPKQMLAEITDGAVVHTLAFLKQKKLIPYKGKPGAFLALSLADRTGILEAKVFDGAEEVAGGLNEGDIVNVSGRASVYQGTLGIILDKITVWDGEVDKADFMRAYPGDVNELIASFEKLLASITDPDLAQILQGIFADKETRAKYFDAPAAMTVHGAYIHGLLEHVVRQAELAETACRLYPLANRDLVIAGVLLHDIGKLWEFSWDLSVTYTTPGKLLGHAVIADRLICETGRELGVNEEKALQLRHLILSHHGTRDFGAVVLPQMLEAVILHSVDNLEAKANRCQELLAKGTGEWTEFDNIEKHQWYRG